MISDASTPQINPTRMHKTRSRGTLLLNVVCFFISVAALLWLLSWRSPITRLEVAETALLTMFAFRFLLWIIAPPL